MTYRFAFADPAIDATLRGMSQRVDQTVGDLLQFSMHSNGAVQPVGDVVEDETGWTISLDIPGVRPEAVEVFTEGRLLMVQAARPAERIQQGARRITQERATGNFARQFRLPRTADVESIAAQAEHGVLTLRVAKLAPVHPRRVQVNVARGDISGESSDATPATTSATTSATASVTTSGRTSAKPSTDSTVRVTQGTAEREASVPKST